MAPEAAVAEEERLRAEREAVSRQSSVEFFLLSGSGNDLDVDIVVGVVGPLLLCPALSLPCSLLAHQQRCSLQKHTLKYHKQQAAAAAAAASDANPPLAEATLTKDRAAELDKLLNQTDLYTKFLSEQMESIEQKTEAEAAAEAAAAAAAAAGGGKKGKKAGKGGAAAAGTGASAAVTTTAAADAAADKKRKRSADGLSPTQELLPLIDGELRDYQLRGKDVIVLGLRDRNRHLSTRNRRKEHFSAASSSFWALLPRSLAFVSVLNSPQIMEVV